MGYRGTQARTLVPWGILQKLLKFAGSDILIFQNKWPEMTFCGHHLCLWQQLLPSQDLMNTRKLMGREEENAMARGTYLLSRESPCLLFSFPELPSLSSSHSSSFSYSQSGRQGEPRVEQHRTLGQEPQEEVWRCRSPALP